MLASETGSAERAVFCSAARWLQRAGREFVETVRALVRGRDWLSARPAGLTVLAKDQPAG